MRGDSVLALFALADVNPRKIRVVAPKRTRAKKPAFMEVSTAPRGAAPNLTRYEGLLAMRVADAVIHKISGSAWHWVASIPATFMTSVCAAFIAYDRIGFQLSFPYSAAIGVASAIVALGFFLMSCGRFRANPVLSV